MKSKKILITAVSILAVNHGMAALSAYDPIVIGGAGNYTAGGVVGQNPTALGFSTPWLNNGSTISAVSTGLSYLNLQTTGGALTTATDNSRNGRQLTTAFTDATSGTFYMSFLMSVNDPTIQGYRAIEFHSGGFDDGGNRKMQFGVNDGDLNGTTFGMRLDGRGEYRSALNTLLAPDVLTHLVVLKMDFSTDSNADTVTTWFDPVSLGGAQPGGSVTTFTGFDLRFDRFSMARFVGGSDRTINADELRIGTTWADVTPVPEVSSSLLMGLAFLGFLRRKR